MAHKNRARPKQVANSSAALEKPVSSEFDLDQLPAEISEALAGIDLSDPRNRFIIQTFIKNSAHFGGWPPADLVVACDKTQAGSKVLFELVDRALSLRHEGVNAERALDQTLMLAELKGDQRLRTIGQCGALAISLGAMVSATIIGINKPDFSGAAIAIAILLVGVGGPTVARAIAEKFKFPGYKPPSG